MIRLPTFPPSGAFHEPIHESTRVPWNYGGRRASSWAGASLFAADAPASPGPNETIHLGVIGCGARCNDTLPNFMKVPGTQVVASAT